MIGGMNDPTLDQLLERLKLLIRERDALKAQGDKTRQEVEALSQRATDLKRQIDGAHGTADGP
jgi:cell division protein FtsB